MKMLIKKFSISLVAVSVLLALGALLGCSNIPEQKGLQLTDLCGRTVTLDGPAQRIAALSASDCEVICELGCEDRIVARGTYCNFPETVKSIKDVGSGELTNIEELIASKPDVVLMSKTGFSLDQVNAMEKAGLKTIVNEVNTLDDTFKYIQLLGKLTGKEDEADALELSINYSIDDFMALASELPSKNVYFQLCDPQYGYWTAGNKTFLNDMTMIMSCKNIFDDVDG